MHKLKMQNFTNKLISSIFSFKFYILLAFFLIEVSTYKNCSENVLWDCPGKSICLSAGDIWQCKCPPEYTFNINYKSDLDYCKPNFNKIIENRTPGSLTINTEKIASAISQKPAGSSHNIIIGSVLIPFCIILLLIALIYGLKRLHILKRARDVIISRRNRPFYEDVMMNIDNDDPPLI